MGTIITAAVLGLISLTCFIICILQFCGKGFLLNNAYLYATKEERATMNKKPYYIQSGVVFALLGVIFAVNALEAVLQTNRLFWAIIGILLCAVIYAIVSSILIEKKQKS